MKKIFAVIVMMVMVLTINAQAPAQRVPATPHPIDKVQPNGDTLTIRLVGDERSHFTMTEDGWLVVENAKGYFCYAIEKKDGTLVAGKKVAHNEANRTKCEVRYLNRKGVKRN